MPDEPQNSIPEENSIPVSPQEPTLDAPIPPMDSESTEVPPVAPEGSTEAESAIPVNNDVSVNEPLARLSLLAKAREIIQFRKRRKLEKIMGMFLKQSSITNDEVEKLLHISDATATRYLEQLEKEGKVKQTGRTGKGVSYIKI